MKSVIILRGVSGSGKSTFADLISDDDSIICCADNYFFDKEGVYRFDSDKLTQAHDFCKSQFDLSLECRIPKIIIANTNTSYKEFEYYEKRAKEEGYMVFHIVVENRHHSKSIHGVPDNTLIRQRDKLRDSILLYY